VTLTNPSLSNNIMDPISFAVGMIGAALVGKVCAELIKANRDRN